MFVEQTSVHHEIYKITHQAESRDCCHHHRQSRGHQRRPLVFEQVLHRSSSLPLCLPPLPPAPVDQPDKMGYWSRSMVDFSVTASSCKDWPPLKRLSPGLSIFYPRSAFKCSCWPSLICSLSLGSRCLIVTSFSELMMVPSLKSGKASELFF